MSNILETLHTRRRLETKLPSGLIVGYHLPNIGTIIAQVGTIPMGAVREFMKDGEELTEEQALEMVMTKPDEALQGLTYQRLLVASMLDDIDGVPVDPGDDREAIVEALEPEDSQALFLIAARETDPNSGEA